MAWKSKEKQKEYYLKNRESFIEKAKKYSKENRDKIRPYQKENAKKWARRNPDKIRETTKKYRSNNKEKKIAWDKASRGKGHIKLEGLCFICKKRPAEVRHHLDYNVPRNVMLICKICHKKIHSNCLQTKPLEDEVGAHIGATGNAVNTALNKDKIADTQSPLTNPTLDVVSRIDEDTFNLSEKVVSLNWHKEQYDKAFNYGIEEGKNISKKENKIINKENIKLKRENDLLKELNSNQEKQLQKYNKDKRNTAERNY